MIIINSNTRQFNVPGADLVFGVSGDSGSEVKHFQCSRYVGNNLDLMSCFVRINFRNGNGKMDSYLVDDMTIDGDNVTFSWLLSPKVTEYRGQVKFVMCVVGPDLKLKWHTTQGTGQVMEGLEPDNSHAESQTADVVAQLIAMVEAQTSAVEVAGAEQVAGVKAAAESARTAAVNEIEAKGVNTRNSIPEDFAILTSTVEKLVRERAGGIVCHAEGEVITLNDASDQAFRGLRIFGKSTQDGTPTPENPVEIVSVGDGGNVNASVRGKNIADIYGFSALGLIRPSETRALSNSHGTTISTTDPGNSIIVTQAKYPNTSDPIMYDNGGFTIGFYNELKHGDVITVSFDVNVAENLSGNNYIGLRPNGGRYNSEDELAQIVNGRVEKTLHWWIDGSAPHKRYLEIRLAGKSMTISNIQIEIGDNATKYESPKKQMLTISTPNGLPGIPVTSGGNYTDANGQQWICDEVDFERGVYVQRCVKISANRLGVVGTYLEFTNCARLSCNLTPKTVLYPNGLSTHLPMMGNYTSDTPHFYTQDSVCWIFAPISELTERNATGVITWAKARSIEFVYILATPIETPLSETELAAYRALHTNKPNTTILNDSGAYMSVDYTADTKLYIDNKIKEALL